MLYVLLCGNKDKNVHRFEPRGRKENEREKGGEGKDRESYIYLYVNSVVYKQFLSHDKLKSM